MKENFTDTTYSLAKALHHINLAKEYLEDTKRDSKGSIKDLLNSYVIKCNYILNNIKDRLDVDSREILKKEFDDSIIIEAINDKIIHLDTEQREIIETLLDSFIRGEKIEFIKD
jgi:hypothetical protein